MWPGVATTWTSSPSTATTSPSPRPSSAEPVGRIEGAYAAADRLRELPCGFGVVEVVMGEQHHGHVAGRLPDRVEVAGIGRARGR